MSNQEETVEEYLKAVDDAISELRSTPVTALEAYHVMRFFIDSFFLPDSHVMQILCETDIDRRIGSVDNEALFQWVKAVHAVREGKRIPGTSEGL